MDQDSSYNHLEHRSNPRPIVMQVEWEVCKEEFQVALVALTVIQEDLILTFHNKDLMMEEILLDQNQICWVEGETVVTKIIPRSKILEGNQCLKWEACRIHMVEQEE